MAAEEERRLVAQLQAARQRKRRRRTTITAGSVAREDDSKENANAKEEAKIAFQLFSLWRSQARSPKDHTAALLTSPDHQELCEQLCHLGGRLPDLSLAQYAYDALALMLASKQSSASPAKSVRLERLKACLMEAKGDVDGARPLLKSLYDEQPTNTFVIRSYVDLLAAHDQKEEAIAFLASHLATNMADVEALLLIANLYLSPSPPLPAQLQKAAYVYEQLILVQPWAVEHYIDYATVLSQLPDEDQSKKTAARKMLCKALEMDPYHHEASLALRDALTAASASTTAALTTEEDRLLQLLSSRA